jgi:hypothetical protein
MRADQEESGASSLSPKLVEFGTPDLLGSAKLCDGQRWIGDDSESLTFKTRILRLDIAARQWARLAMMSLRVKASSPGLAESRAVTANKRDALFPPRPPIVRGTQVRDHAGGRFSPASVGRLVAESR